ncbi:MAG: HepT-like ribonuclease domain-containing protein [Peptoniphilaceae bacterium]|nr:HepT-like ribonuclease domain-containing protein [Peptoniphilaceae bacterium]
MVRLKQISENSERLTEAFKDQHSEIRWHTIRGLHNRMVHEYGNVDLKVIYDTVKDD